MNAVFYTLVGLVLITLQTTVMPALAFWGNFFDLLVALVIYLGLFRPVRESLLFVFILGIIADSLSGTPLMLYVTTYLWVYACVRWLNNTLQIGMRFRFPLIIGAGVLLENLIIVLAVMLWMRGPASAPVLLKAAAGQLLWAFFLGTVLVLLFQALHNGWDSLVGQWLVRRSEIGARNGR
jgi:cell shape-determining protein MreD